MIKLGITGGIGSGKTVVSKIFSICGIPVYSADDGSKKLITSSPIIKEKLINIFGSDLFKTGQLNKKLLASYIFNDPDKLKLVNSIIHPEVKKDFLAWTIQQNSPMVGYEAAILFESGSDSIVDKIVTVYAPLEIRIERVMLRDGVTREKVLERITCQLSDEEKIRRSNFIIRADETCSLIEQTLAILKTLQITV